MSHEEEFDDYVLDPASSSIEKPPRTIDLRGEIEITVRKSLTKDAGDVVLPSELVVSVTVDDVVQEGRIHLSPAKVKRFLKLLELQDV